MQDELAEFLAEGPTVERDDPAVRALAARAEAAGGSPRERAVRLYYMVRDEIYYDPYTVALDEPGLKASRTLADGRGWCVSKAILLAAACRAMEIPAGLGFADVRNHMSTAKMRERMQTDIFYWHGYTDIWLDGAWRKATPAFNIELCDKFGLKPLEFDGVEDSIYHPFDKAGQRHMEYLNHRGRFAEPPMAEMRDTFVTHYPHWRVGEPSDGGDFEAEVAREVAG